MEDYGQTGLKAIQGFLISLCLLVLSFPLLAEQHSLKPLVLSNQSIASAGLYAEYFEDKSRKLTLDSILNNADQSFNFSTREVLTFGRSSSAWWVRFNLINQADLPWYLLLDANLGEDLDIFLLPVESPDKTIHSDLFNHYAMALEDYPRHVWQLSLPKGETFKVYIRATNGGSILNLPIQFMQANALIKHTFYNYRLVSFVFTGMLVLAAYQLLMFLILRESSYIILTIYMLSMMLTLHRNMPIFAPLSFLSNTGSHFFTAPFFIVIAAHAGFARSILNTAYYAPKLDWGFKVIIVLALSFLLIVGFLPASSDYPPILGLILLPLTFFSGLYVASRGYRLALYFTLIYLINLSIYLPILVVLIWDTSMWQPLQDVSFSLGALVFMLFLSIIQAERMRSLREQVSQAELTDKTKDEFLAVMSHEFRTPMNAVVGLAVLLKLTPLSSLQKIYVDKLELATHHMTQLISNLLDFAKFRNTNFKPAEEPFKLVMVINSVVSLLEQQAEQKGLAFNFEVSGSLEDNLLGDRLRITQVLFNLLDNAIKYTERGSVTLKIITRPEAFGFLNVRFKVIDTGRGIDSNELSRLFEPFVQAHSSFERRQGVGLGLAISKRLVDVMGGRIKIESTVGKGSKFIVELSFKLAPFPLNATQSLLTPIGRKLSLSRAATIVLVDRSELSRLVAGAMLRELGASVLFAETTVEAKKFLEQYPIDLILLELTGTNEDTAFVTWLHQQAQGKGLPLIGIVDKQPAQASEQWVTAYLGKPFDYEHLHAVLSKTLGLD